MSRVFKYGLIALVFMLVDNPLSYGQNLTLAQHYLKDAQYDKALNIYRDWYEQHGYRREVYRGILKVYLQKAGFNKAVAFIREVKSKYHVMTADVDLYHVFRMAGKEDEARKQWENIRQKVRKQPVYALSYARSLRAYGYTDMALELLRYEEKRKPTPGLYLEMGNLYAEKYALDSMMQSYVRATEMHPGYVSYIQYALARYIDTKENNPHAGALKKVLLQKIAQHPMPEYFRLLLWFYTRRQQYDKAFVQAKGLFLRGQMRPGEMYQLAAAAHKQGDDDTALDILAFLQKHKDEIPRLLAEQTETLRIKILARKLDQLPEDFALQWKRIADTIQYGHLRFEIYRSITDIMIDRKDWNTALHWVDSLAHARLPIRHQAFWQERKGDILLQQGKFARAAIVFSLLRDQFKYDEVNYRALYKIALASFFDGDPDWAHRNLKPLKKAASRDIANDALMLDFMIIANRDKNDSLQTGLKNLAKSYYFYYTGRTADLHRLADSLRQNTKTEKIADDLVYLEAKAETAAGNTDKALYYWQELLKTTKEKMFLEEALYRTGTLLARKGQTESAKKTLMQVIREYPEGYYFEPAQKAYRQLTEKQKE